LVLRIADRAEGVARCRDQLGARLAFTTLPLVAAGTSVHVLAVAVFLSGIAVSPTFITAFGVIERRVPEAMLTEGITWVMTGIGIGMALGAFLMDWVVDSFGARNGSGSPWVRAATVLMVALGQCRLAGGGGQPVMGKRHQLAE
jgi:hypothetical protein